VRVFFQDEASFGRISEPSYCWCPAGTRPVVSCHRVREYMHLYGAVEPKTGESFFLVLPRANTECMSVFVNNLSEEYPHDTIILVVDNATWHTTKKLTIPDNIVLFFIPPATPEMNPIEQLWKEIRKIGFKNVAFKTLNEVVDKLCTVVSNLSNETIQSICKRNWMKFVF